MFKSRLILIARTALWICTAAVVVPLVCKLTWEHYFGELIIMNGTTTSTWYYIISTLGIYHSHSPIVNTTGGRVQGIISASREGREFYEFRAIPYAKAPVDSLRFEPPVPAEPWEGVFTADKSPPPCLQFDAMIRGEIIGQEDCLKLNVFTPNLNPDELLPVIAYIHGGGFTGGESSFYDPKYWMDHDILIVTFNYRLASLGFLNTGDELIRGNMGLKDQNMALRWIQENIHEFGGNSQKVTLMGESAGGASTHYHVISPLSRGLFSRAIVQSGSLGSPWSFTRNPRNQALKFGAQLNCPVDNTSVLVKCLKKLDPRDIVKPHVIIMSPIHTQDDFFPGSVEAITREDTFLSENPYKMLEKGDFAQVPIMFGVNDGEGGLKAARLESYSEVLEELSEKWNSYMPILLHYDPNRTEISDKLRSYYFSKTGKTGETIKVDPVDDMFNLTKILGAGIFFEGNARMAKMHVNYAPTYLYYYTYISETMPGSYALIRAARPQRWYSPWFANIAQNLVMYYADKYIWRSKDPKKYGACHGDDISQAFSMNPIMDVKTVSSDFPFSKEFVKTFVQFASDDENLSFNGVQWPGVNKKDKRPKYMQMDSTGSVIDEPFTEDVEFIQSLNIRDPNEQINW